MTRSKSNWKNTKNATAETTDERARRHKPRRWSKVALVLGPPGVAAYVRAAIPLGIIGRKLELLHQLLDRQKRIR
jgi:hypothetical protein